MNIAGHFLKFFVYSNLFIAFCAVSLCAESQVLIRGWFSVTPVTMQSFFATMFVYSMHRFTRLKNDESDIPRKYYPLLLASVIISLAANLIFLFINPLRVNMVLLVLGILSLFYSFGIPGFSMAFLPLRKIPFMKIFLVSFTWATATVALPFLELHHSLRDPAFILIFTRRMLFVFSITVPFDIRDMRFDHESGVRTIPLRFGEDRARWVAYCALFLFVVLSAVQYGIMDPDGANLLGAMIFSALVSFFLIRNSHTERSPGYFLFWIDGMMLLQFILVEVALLFKSA